MKKIIIAVFATLMMVGCATKQYPQTPNVSTSEEQQYTCEQIKLELIRADSIRSEINKTSEFDARSVFSFLGDFGLGNVIAETNAREKLENRYSQLKVLELNKCS
ncbi:conserved hypothetical protein [Aeromonas phage 65]|uniref:Lipoprotein n=2 Tax=Ishigurovirus osborne TaxID=260149 RepID=A0A219YCG9_9CAUD|nr:hypothetical protein ST65p327 [Aeromonas phage 65]ADQ53335.1 conserved hypothetical protein [Aeromonas phage 65]APU01696.1 hypothetical protein [Aeromonas phage 65.2]